MTDRQGNSGGFAGFLDSQDFGGDFNATTFLIQSILSRISTSTLVQIQGVTNSGGLSPVGYVDVLPLVNQVDGAGAAVPHGTVYHLPYFRLQGGSDAVIIDPKVGDIGIAVFADHDISSVKVNKAQSNPGSGRRFDMADGIYIGGVLNGTPTQYVRFSGSGISIVSPTEVDISAPVVRINAATSLHVDCDGNGFVYTPTTRDDYSIGLASSNTHNLNPPKVP